MHFQYNTLIRLKIFFLFFVLFSYSGCKTHKIVIGEPVLVVDTKVRKKITPRNEQLIASESILWTWKTLGPDVKPEDNLKAGNSLPTYSFGRGNGSGKIHFFYINPKNRNQIFACSGMGGLFVSNDHGENWVSGGTDKLPISGVGSVSVNPKNDKMWIISTGDPDDTYNFSDGLWLTKNAGKTWKSINGSSKEGRFPVNESNNKTYISKVVGHPKNFNIVFVASSKGLFLTKNALAKSENIHWTLVDDSFYYDIEIPSWNTDIVLASGNKFIISYNSGENWKRLPLPEYDNKEQFKFLRISMELTSADKNNVFAVITNNEKHTRSKQGNASFQKFNLDSLSWIKIRSLRTGMNNMLVTRARAFAVSPIDSNLILVGNVQPIYRSVDGGLNFSQIEKRQMHDDIHHIEFSKDGKEVWCANDGGISVSYDEGLTWESKDNGLSVAMVYGVDVAQSEEPIYLYGGFDTGGNYYKDGKWSHVLWGDGFESIINYNNPDTMFVTRQNGYIYRSDDGGLSWNKNVRPKGNSLPWYTWVKMNKRDPQTIYTTGKTVSRSFNSGDDWETIFDLNINEQIWIGFKVYLSETNPDVMYAYFLDKDKNSHPILYRTFNVNASDINDIEWENISVPKMRWITSIVPDDINPEHYWLTYQKGNNKESVYFYDGESYTDMSLGLGRAEIKTMILEKNNNGRVYLGTTYGVFTRDRNDKEWTLLKGLPGTYIRSIAINYVTQKLIVGTDGRGLWEGDLLRD